MRALFLFAICLLPGCKIPDVIENAKPVSRSEKIDADIAAAIKAWQHEQQQLAEQQRRAAEMRTSEQTGTTSNPNGSDASVVQIPNIVSSPQSNPG